MSARPQRPSKIDLVVVSDEEDEPAAKRRAEELQPIPSQKVIRLQQKVAKLEKDLQGAIRIAGEHQSRVEYLESLIDVKPNVGAGREANQVAELQKRLADTSKELDKVKKDIAIDITCRKLNEELRHKLAETSKQLDETNRRSARREEELQKMIHFLELRAEERRVEANSDRERERARLASVLAQLKDATGREKAVAEKEFEAAQEIKTLKMDIVDMRTTIHLMHSDVPDLQERVNTLAQQLEAEQQRARNAQMKHRARIDDLSKQLAQCGLQQPLSGSPAVPTARAEAGADQQQQQPAAEGALAGFGMPAEARQLYDGLMDMD